MSEEETTTTVENVDVEQTPEATEEVVTTEEAKAEPETTSTEDAETTAKEETKAEKPKLSPEQKKIAKQARVQRELQRELKASRLQNTQLAEAIERQSKPESKAPKIEDFETMDKYLDARDSHRDSTRETAAKKAEPTTDNTYQHHYDDMVMNGSDKYDDFEEIVNSSQNVTLDMATAILDIDDPDLQSDVAYFIGQNPKEAARISKLPERRQIAEMAKLEVKLSAKPAAKKQVSNAPKPIKPIGGTKTSTDGFVDGESFESFLKKRHKQLGRT